MLIGHDIHSKDIPFMFTSRQNLNEAAKKAKQAAKKFLGNDLGNVRYFEGSGIHNWALLKEHIFSQHTTSLEENSIICITSYDSVGWGRRKVKGIA